MFKELSLECLMVASSLIWKKEKLAKMVTRCHSLSLIVIRCHSLYHSLSLVVIRCTTRLSFYKRSNRSKSKRNSQEKQSQVSCIKYVRIQIFSCSFFPWQVQRKFLIRGNMCQRKTVFSRILDSVLVKLSEVISRSRKAVSEIKTRRGSFGSE